MESKKEARLELSEQEMLDYGHRIVDLIADHHATQRSKNPVAVATRKEMDTVFSEEAPENPTDAHQVLDFVMDQVIPGANILSHPKFFSFVPGPSNYISVMADSLATGFNVFSGGWQAAPAAAELEIVTMNWMLKMYGLPEKKVAVFLPAAVQWQISPRWSRRAISNAGKISQRR